MADLATYFYPIGNTPAVSLIQGSFPKSDVDILLLGCGDVRNILFTTFCNNEPLRRKLDITCCDLQPAILGMFFHVRKMRILTEISLARNVLLFTLLVDDTIGEKTSSHWQIYYHIYLDAQSSAMLEVQAQKLFQLAQSKDTWDAGDYGKLFKFYDGGTLPILRRIWESYCISSLTTTERVIFNNVFARAVQKAVDENSQRLGSMTNMSGLRSAAPVNLDALKDITTGSKHFWSHGTTDKTLSRKLEDKIPNRMFASSATTSLTIHYGIDPHLGFPLAFGYVPTIPESEFNSAENRATQAARRLFRDWSETFRSHLQKHLTIRIFVGDAIAFCQSLQHRRSQPHGGSNWYRSYYSMEPLTLHETGLGPLSFEVIDSSNLADHLGVLNVMAAASPLLKDNLSATLHTESLVMQEKDREALRAKILCGNFPTMAIILGLMPTEYWTNASAISTVEGSITEFLSGNSGYQIGHTQMLCRMSWKRNVPTSSLHASAVRFKSDSLASILHNTYRNMFPHQNLSSMFAGLSSSTLGLSIISHRPNQCYSRSSLVAILKLLKSNLVVNWPEFVEGLVSRIENDTEILVGMNHIQEFHVQLELQHVYRMPSLVQQTFPATMMNGIGSWVSKPLVVCVTLLIPRSKLGVLTSQSHLKLGTPALQATIQNKTGFMAGAFNIFADLQLGFGKITTYGERTDPSFKLSVEDDPKGWFGTSDLLISFFVPTTTIMLSPESCYVSLSIQSSPMHTAFLSSSLGLQLNIFQAHVTDNKHVFISQYAPCQNAYRFLGPVALPDRRSNDDSIEFTRTMSANADVAQSKITTLTGRIDLTSDVVKRRLEAKATVTVEQNCPYSIRVRIHPALHYDLVFPCPVKQVLSTTRIARKSAYIEVIVPMADHVTGDGIPEYICSTVLTNIGPLILNMPYVPIQALPVLDITKPLNWLTIHTSLQMSNRERILRGGQDVVGPALVADVRVNYKESLLAMFMRFTGTQLTRCRVFVLNKPDVGVQLLILISSLRLDLASHTVVLDCAVIPLEFRALSDLFSLLTAGKITSNIIVDYDEMKLWKTMIPAHVERCRVWEHKPGCEYQTKFKVPLSFEDGEPVLCSCGVNQFPNDFFSDLPHWNVARKYATRAAISPCFSIPYVEKIFDAASMASDITSSMTPTNPVPGKLKCAVCGREKSREGKKLLVCKQCKEMRYCSAECQKAHWKKHKGPCKLIFDANN